MWEPRPLTTLWAFTACYRDSFTVNFYSIIQELYQWRHTSQTWNRHWTRDAFICLSRRDTFIEPRPRCFMVPCSFPTILTLKGEVRSCHFETNFSDYTQRIYFFLNGYIKSEHLTALVWVMSQLKLLTHWGAAFIFTAQQSLVKLASNHFPHSARAQSDSIKYNTRDCPSAEKISRVICRALCFVMPKAVWGSRAPRCDE
jgi:hypothetical protein